MPMEKTFNPAEAEARISKLWTDRKVGAAGANARPGEKMFSIMIPPPNVTGSLHMGHAFNNTLQDILIRWHRMQGHDTLWQVGTDHAGIATQMVVERELALTQQPGRREMGRDAFLAKVWAWKDQSGGTIINQLKRLGASCDWDREAFTMSGNFPDAVTKVFVDMYNKGLIYRGKRLVNWDPHFETALTFPEQRSATSAHIALPHGGQLDVGVREIRDLCADDRTACGLRKPALPAPASRIAPHHFRKPFALRFLLLRMVDGHRTLQRCAVAHPGPTAHHARPPTRNWSNKAFATPIVH